MSYTLFYYPYTASLTVHWLLLELDLPHTLHLVDFSQSGQKDPAFLRLNPHGRVPVLTIKDKEGKEETYSEQAALLLILAERHPEAGLFPTVGSSQREKAVELLIYLSTNLLPTARDHAYSDRDPEDPSDGPAIKRLATLRGNRIWTFLDNHLEGKDYMLGNGQESLSVLDFLVVAMMTWPIGTKLGATKVGKGNLGRLAERMVKRESWRKVLESEGDEGFGGWPGSA